MLRVDLSSGTFSVEPLDRDLRHRYIGGKGLAGHYLAAAGGLDWDDPELPLLVFTGPLVGTSAPTSGRITVMTRSPLTGALGDASVGGRLGTELKRAGLDGLVITGHAPRPTGLVIRDAEIRLTDATPLTGLPLSEAARVLPDSKAWAMIGPAAECGVRFASLMVDGHFAAARAGVGLAFARRNLKYLAVSGSGKVAVADPAGLKRAREDIFRLVAASPVLLGEQGISSFGTPVLYDLMHARRMMPTRNFCETRFAAAPGLGAHALHERFSPKSASCRGCHIRCKKLSHDGRAIPEFESLSHFTALVGNDDLETAVQANHICNELGMDTISAASAVACHAEINGEALTADVLLNLLEDTGRGRGVGLEIGAGSSRLAAAAGRPELAMAVKGQDLPAYDPRGAYGMALAYATSTRGGCHLRAYPISHEILRKPVATDRFSFSGKARIIKIAEDVNAVVDSLTACKFVFLACSLEEYSKALAAVTGEEITANDLSRKGERIYYNERIINHRYGFDAEADDLPPRFFESPGTPGGGIRVPPIDRQAFLETRARYYRIRGLDSAGRPTRAKAEELGLKWNG